MPTSPLPFSKRDALRLAGNIAIGRVTVTGYRRAAPRLVETGLLGYVSIVIADALCVHRVAVRRTLAGRYALSFARRPLRRVPGSRDWREDPRDRYPLSHPLTAEAHVEIEKQVIAQLRERGVLP